MFSIPSPVKRARAFFFLSHEELLKENIKKVIDVSRSWLQDIQSGVLIVRLVSGAGCRGGSGTERGKVKRDKFFLGSRVLECNLH